MNFSQNVYFKDISMLKLPFLYFSKMSRFFRFPSFSSKIAILSQLWTKISDRETLLTPPNVLISHLLLYIYHYVKNSLYQVLFWIWPNIRYIVHNYDVINAL